MTARLSAARLFVDAERQRQALGFVYPRDFFVLQVEGSGDFVACSSFIASGRMHTAGPGVVHLEDVVLEDVRTVAMQPGLGL